MRILPFKFLNDSIEKIKVRKLSTNKWSNMRQLMDNTKFDSINSSKEQGIDGAWYHIDIIYVKRSNKHINLWSGYAPESLIKIHEFIRENLNKNGANN